MSGCVPPMPSPIKAGWCGKVTALPREDPSPPARLAQYKALITAGGIGTRLLPFSKEIPKEVFPIIARNGDGSLQLKPVIQAIFEQLYTAGIRTYYFVVGKGKRAIEDHFSTDFRFLEYLSKRGKVSESLSAFYEKIGSSDLVFLNQIEPLGFGNAVLLGRGVVRGPFLVQAADTFILSDHDDWIDRLATMHQKYNAAATLLFHEVPDPRQYGVVEGDFLEEGVLRIASAVEKPREPRSTYAIIPIYLFTDVVFDALSGIKPGLDGELQLTDAIQRLVAQGKSVIGVGLREDERRLDLGTVETMVEALKASLADAVGEASMEPEGTGTPWIAAPPHEPESGLADLPRKPGRSVAQLPSPKRARGRADRP